MHFLSRTIEKNGNYAEYLAVGIIPDVMVERFLKVERPV
jgi:hypothetical protein